MNIRELQSKAKTLEESDPDNACNIYLQALDMDKENRYTLSCLGRSLRAAKRPKEFIDLCNQYDSNVLTDQYVLSAYCWCLYDTYIKIENENINEEEFFDAVTFVVANSKQLAGEECHKTPFIITIFKAIRVLGNIEENNFDFQLELLSKINPEILPTKKNVVINTDGETEKYDSFKEQFYSLKSWILYKQIIRPYNEAENKEGFDNFIAAAEFITSFCNQKKQGNTSNPYVWTVLKVINVYNRRDNKNYKKILEWVTKLNPEDLSDDVFIITDDTGTEREQASPKEYYYQYASKAYEKLLMHKECVAVCDFGLNQIKRWHYRNHIWIRARREYCNCYISDNFERDIKAYILLAEKEKHWFMFHKVALLFFSRGQSDNSLLYASKAINSNSKIDPEKMINLLYDLGLILQSKSNYTLANKFFQACGYYRTLNGWTISEELKFIIADNYLDVAIRPDLRYLQNSTKKFAKDKSEQRLVGTITSILQYGNGFIDSNNQSYYFSSREGKGLKVNQEVTFELGLDNKNRKIACNICVKGV